MVEDNRKVEELNQIIYEMKILEETAKELEIRKNEYMIQQQDIERALLALSEISKGEKEIILPLGGNTFVKAEIKDTKKVLRNIGAGVIMNESISTALEKIERTKKDIEVANKKIEEQINNINERMKEINEKISSANLPYIQ